MPAQVVLVHDEEAFSAKVGRALAASGYQVMAFPDPLVALAALEDAECLELLITRIEFPPGRSNGQALALMARKTRPNVKVLFMCPPQFNRYVADLGEVLLAPATVSGVVETAMRLFPPPRLQDEGGLPMTEERYAAKLAEVNDLINNPDMPLRPARIWQLMEEIPERAETEVDHEVSECGGVGGYATYVYTRQAGQQ